MSASEIIAELPRLNEAERRAVRQTLSELVAQDDEVRVCDATVSEQAATLDPMEEQTLSSRLVEALPAVADQIHVRFDRARQQVEKLTPSLLTRAFRGELVPQDPTAAPAARLLERIHANRDS